MLNSLPGEAIPRGIAALAVGGRFLEIGKRDIYADASLGLHAFGTAIVDLLANTGPNPSKITSSDAVTASAASTQAVTSPLTFSLRCIGMTDKNIMQALEWTQCATR